MPETTVDRKLVLELVRSCGVEPRTLRGIPGDGPPLDGELVAHLVSAVLGSPAGWRHLVELRPELADLDRRDIRGVLGRVLEASNA